MAAGRLSGPEWKRYADPATELDVIRLTDPAFASGMTAPHLRQFARRGESLLYWSERYAGDSPGARQAFLLDLKQGESRQLTQAAALDSASLSLSPDERTFVFFDGRSLYESPLSNVHLRQIHVVPEDAVRTGLSLASDGAVLFSEREDGKSRIVSVFRQQSRRVADTELEIEELMTRPRHAQILYRTRGDSPGGPFWMVNSDGSGKRQLKTEPGQTGGALWIPSGRTLVYLHIPEDPKELITLREHAPDDGTDRLLAKTSQFISASPNADASVFTGASRSRATAYVLILLRVARRELTLCEHRASDPAMVKPVFSPDSQSITFTSDRHGKPALYQVHVGRFVEETSADPQ
jgi:oligogalacturonide lyase